MKLHEFEVSDLDNARYDPNRDQINQRHLSDTRKKPALTLRRLNRLKKLRALRDLEAEKHEDLLVALYGIPDSTDAGMGGGGFGGGGQTF